MQTRRALASLVSLAALSGLIALGGCSAERSQLADVRFNPTPELATLDATPDERANGMALNTSTNLRALNADVARVVYLNRPSRMSPEPIR